MIVVYIDRNRLQFFEAGWSSVLSLDLPETILRDLDVVSRVEFVNLVKPFLHAHTLRPSPMFFILSEALCFSHVLVGEESAKERQLEEWVGMVPFESVHVRRYTVDGQDVGIVIPKNFTETIEQIFEGEGFRLVAIIPSQVLGSPMAEKRWLDVAMGTYALKEANTLVRQSMLPKNESFTSPAPTQGRNLRLLMFIGLFVFFILILIVLILRPS